MKKRRSVRWAAGCAGPSLATVRCRGGGCGAVSTPGPRPPSTPCASWLCWPSSWACPCSTQSPPSLLSSPSPQLDSTSAVSAPAITLYKYLHLPSASSSGDVETCNLESSFYISCEGPTSTRLSTLIGLNLHGENPFECFGGAQCLLHLQIYFESYPQCWTL